MATEKRLIDALPLMRNGWILLKTGKSNRVLSSMSLADVPEVDAVEVVHGRWIEKVDMVASYLADCEETFYECSVCNSPNFGESPYCPNCGAKMDGDGNA